jgi:creatinine amidohydrolase/Fe(II)-dependent formamide hydrolase-like protein
MKPQPTLSGRTTSEKRAAARANDAKSRRQKINTSVRTQEVTENTVASYRATHAQTTETPNPKKVNSSVRTQQAIDNTPSQTALAPGLTLKAEA